MARRLILDLPEGPFANRFVRLEPLSEAHHESLLDMARTEADSFTFWPYRHDGDWGPLWLGAITKRVQDGSARAFAVIEPATGDTVGMTAWLGIESFNPSVEIGSTAYRQRVQGTAINPAAKRLMLGEAFAAGAERVSFQVDTRNARSRAAVRKLGAVEEGILRRNRRTASGYVRDTAIYSIVKEEWPGVRDRLDARLEAFGG